MTREKVVQLRDAMLSEARLLARSAVRIHVMEDAMLSSGYRGIELELHRACVEASKAMIALGNALNKFDRAMYDLVDDDA